MDQYASTPAPILTIDPQCKIPKSDVETIQRQACMYTASGDIVCDTTRRDGQTMIVNKACAKPPLPNGYSL